MNVQQEAEVLRMLETTRHPYRIQVETRTQLSEVRRLMRQEPSELPGWGRPSLHPYILSRRGVNAYEWPREDRGLILEHRRLHDQGKTTMCQGRDGQYIIQYSIPTRVTVRRAPYFHGGV